jgi:hypothetical protein
MLPAWLSIGTTPFNRRNTTAYGVGTPGFPVVGSTRGSVPSAARPTGISHAHTRNAVRTTWDLHPSGRRAAHNLAEGRAPTTPEGQS